MKCSTPSMENGYNIKVILLCLRMSFRKWFLSLRIPMLFLLIISFGYWTSGDVSSVAKIMGERVAPWLLPHYFANPLMMTLFGFLVTFLFNDAPFYDNHTAFVLIRSGRKNWIVAQILYVIVAAFLNAVCWFLASILPVLGRVQFTSDWGKVLLSIASGQGQAIAAQHGVVLNFYVDANVCKVYSGLETTLLAFLLLWLVGAFLGFLIFAFNFFLKNNWGVIVSGFLSFLPVFSSFLLIYGGELGSKIFYVSPVGWCSLYSISLDGKMGYPSLPYVFSVLVIGSLIMAFVLGRQFRKKDVLI